MKCPECGSFDVTVIDTRRNEETVIRRRMCNKCFNRFNTCEITVEDHDSQKEKERFLKEIFEKIRRECFANVRKEMLNENESCT